MVNPGQSERPAWQVAMEGEVTDDADAPHWIAVYTSLIETMSTIAQDVSGINPRIDEMRDRLRFWERRLQGAE